VARTGTRTQKKLEQAAGGEVFQPEIPMTPAEEQIPIVNVTHREVRTWTQAKPMDEIGEDEFEDEDQEESPAEENRFGVNDPIAKVLSEIAGSGSNWALQVNRLTDYERNQRTDPKSRRFVGTLSVPDADYLKEEKFLEDLQAKFARGSNGNWFLLCVRRDNRNFAYLPPVCVEPPLPEVQAARAAENPGASSVNIYPAPAQQDGFKQFVQQAKQFAELRDLLFPGGTSEPLHNAQPAAAPQQSKAAQLIDLIADDEIVDNVTSKLKRALRGNNGSNEQERGWLDVLYMAVERDTLPKLINTFASQFGGLRNVQAPMSPPHVPIQQEGQPLGWNNVPATETINQSPQAAPHVPLEKREGAGVAPSTQSPEIYLLNKLIDDCFWQVDPDISADWVYAFMDRQPQIKPAMDNFCATPPEQLRAFLLASVPEAQKLANAPHVVEWITALQTSLMTPPEGETEDEQTIN